MVPDRRKLEAAVATTFEREPGDVDVEVVDVDVPGLLVFVVDAGRRGLRGGIYDGETLEFDKDVALPRMAAAWGYGPDRTVPPTVVASAVAALLGTSAYIDEAAVRGSAAPPDAEVPRETELDGDPAVSFWVSDGRRGHYPVVVAFRGTGEVELKR